jgi:hypothetical protein
MAYTIQAMHNTKLHRPAILITTEQLEETWQKTVTVHFNFFNHPLNHHKEMIKEQKQPQLHIKSY